jgi:hypothetical protein
VADETKREGKSPGKGAGPDPAVGIGLFVVGLLIMATGGATTQHYVFNAGEGLVLLGAVIFLASVAITNHRLEPLDLRAIARKVIGRE